jgi:hypothetical protein
MGWDGNSIDRIAYIPAPPLLPGVNIPRAERVVLATTDQRTVILECYRPDSICMPCEGVCVDVFLGGRSC